MIDNKIAGTIIKFSKHSLQKNSETVTNENDKKIPKEKHISLEDRQKIIDNLRLIMEYQKIINLLDNIPNHPTKSRTNNWVEINYESHGVYKTGSQIKFKNSMLKSSLCDYSDVYIFVKRNISIEAQVEDNPNNGDKEVVFKNYAPFTDCISEINNTQIDNSKDTDLVMPMYDLIEI